MIVDETAETYTVTRSPYVLYDPATLIEGGSTEVYIYEPSQGTLTVDSTDIDYYEKLEENVSFDEREGIESITPDPDPFILIFNPSGTVTIGGTGIASLQIAGRFLDYEIRVYKGGQINLEGRSR
jgi:hypothetical protein